MGASKEKVSPAIPADEVTPEVILGGITITLGPKEVFWRTDTGSIELNAFTGELSMKVDGKKLTDMEMGYVLNGIRTGRIIVVNKPVKGKPIDTKWQLSEYAPGARKLLDYDDKQFTEAVSGNYSLRLLQTALEIEREGKNRSGRIKALSMKLTELARSE